jgi:hypothetical protein
MRRPLLAVVAALALIVAFLVGLPAQAASESLFTVTPPNMSASDTAAVTLGTHVTAKVAGRVTAVRFYKGTGNTGTHTGAVYSADGSLAVTGNFTSETASGWQTWTPASAVRLTAGASFTAAVFMPKGRYAYANTYAWPVQTASLTGSKGVYVYGSSLKRPTTVYQTSNYFIDVQFTPDVAVTPTPTQTPTSSVTPSPSVTPTSASPTPTPSSTPTVSGFPDETTTGVPAGTALKRVPQDATSGTGWHWDTRGWVEIDGAGAVFSGFQVTGTNIDISANNVTVSNSEIVNSQGGWGITLRHATGVTLDRNTIRGTSVTDPGDNAIRDIYGDADGVRITGNNVYWWGSGINHFDTGGLIQGNFIHDLKNDSTGQQHLNGIQLGSGSGPLMTIDHNTILNPDSQTDAIMLANDDGAQTNRTITNNLLAGGGYTFYGAGGPAGSAANIRFTGNRFSTRYYPQSGYWGAVAYWKSGNVWSDNVWFDGPNAGQPVNP